jgi:hypothetical protein
MHKFTYEKQIDKKEKNAFIEVTLNAFGIDHKIKTKEQLKKDNDFLTKAALATFTFVGGAQTFESVKSSSSIKDFTMALGSYLTAITLAYGTRRCINAVNFKMHKEPTDTQSL